MVLLLCTALRMALIQEARDNWALTTLLPLSTLLLCMVPVAIPVTLVLAEALATAGMRSTVPIHTITHYYT